MRFILHRVELLEVERIFCTTFCAVGSEIVLVFLLHFSPKALPNNAKSSIFELSSDFDENHTTGFGSSSRSRIYLIQVVPLHFSPRNFEKPAELSSQYLLKHRNRHLARHTIRRIDFGKAMHIPDGPFEIS